MLLVEGRGGAAADGGGGGEASEVEIVAALQAAVAAGESPSSAARSVAARLGVSRKRCYSLSLSLGLPAVAEGAEGEVQPID